KNSKRNVMALKLTMAFSDNPRVQPLKDGLVKPQGIELDCITLDPGNLFQRNLTYDEFDVSEMSLSETLLARERTDGTKWDWSALPVFLSRGHHWHTLYVNTSSGIKSLADLRGKRIGVPDYDMTAALWFRIALKDLHGIEAKDNVWYNGRTKALSHGGALGLHNDGPVGVTHHWLTVDQTLDVMLDRGEIDACTAIRPQPRVTAGDSTVVDRWGGTPIDGNPRLKKLLDDDGKEVVYEFYRKTGCFQANHHVIVQNRILKEHPGVALELYKAFQRSKEVAYERARRSQSTYLFFPGKDFEEQAAIFGDDPYPIGLRAMSKTVERAIRGSQEQGLLRRPLRLEDIYYRTKLRTRGVGRHGRGRARYTRDRDRPYLEFSRAVGAPVPAGRDQSQGRRRAGILVHRRQDPRPGSPGRDVSRRLRARGEARPQDGGTSRSARGRKRGGPPEA